MDQMFQQVVFISQDVFSRIQGWIKRFSGIIALPLVCLYWILITTCIIWPKFVNTYIHQIDYGFMLFVHGPVLIFTIVTRLLLGPLRETEVNHLCSWFWIWLLKTTILLSLLETTDLLPGSLYGIGSFLFQLGAFNLVCTLAKLKYGNILRQLSKQPRQFVGVIPILLIPAAVFSIFFLAFMLYQMVVEIGYRNRLSRSAVSIIFPYLLLTPLHFMLLVRLIYVISDCGAYYYGVLQNRPPLGCFYYFKLSTSIFVTLGNAFICATAIAFGRVWTRYVVLMGVVYIGMTVYNSLKLYADHLWSLELAQTMQAAIDLPSIDELREYDDVCPICTEKLVALNCVKVKTCGHVYHKNCLLSVAVVFTGDHLCPMCRQPIFYDNV